MVRQMRQISLGFILYRVRASDTLHSAPCRFQASGKTLPFSERSRPSANRIFRLVSTLQFIPCSIRPMVMGESPAFLASSALLISRFSLISLTAFRPTFSSPLWFYKPGYRTRPPVCVHPVSGISQFLNGFQSQFRAFVNYFIIITYNILYFFYILGCRYGKTQHVVGLSRHPGHPAGRCSGNSVHSCFLLTVRTL